MQQPAAFSLPVVLASDVSVVNAAPVLSTTAGAESIVTFTRTADTAAYAANDVIGINNAGAAGNAIHTFTLVGPLGNNLLITGADLSIDLAAVTAGMTGFELHIYAVSPTAILDNAAFNLVAADIAKHIAVIPLGVPVDYGTLLYTSAENLNKQVKLDAALTSFFAELVTLGAWTPASGTTFQMRLRTLSV